MQFKHPEFLYALFALIIPILVHLFQLRRFKKLSFTNVQFLKSVSQQTRKSARIKKWLTLLARLCLFTAIILSFAQPFFASKKVVDKKTETVLYLDNSFSMQAKGAKGPLLKRATQEILSDIPEDEVFSIFTNTQTFSGISKKDIQNDLLQIEYSSNQLSYSAAFLKAKQLAGSSDENLKRVVLISDFQEKNGSLDLPKDTITETHLVQLRPVNYQNIAIDSIFINRNAKNELMLQIIVSNSESESTNKSVALYNEDKLIAKTSISIPENDISTTEFKLDETTRINGKVVIEDTSLSFDNVKYFTINTPKKIKVLSINEASDDYLKRIFTPDEFEFITTSVETLNYNQISTVNTIILNEINQIPTSLANALKTFADAGGTVCFIPAASGNLTSYRQFMNSLSLEGFLSQKKQEKKITTIHFSHPLYRGVFDKKISNFQYPKVNSYFLAKTNNTVLSYEDNSPFLYKSGNLYTFTAALNIENSNFKNSPLIVPTLYKIAKQSLKLSEIAYTIGKNNSYDIPVTLGQDKIVSLVSKEESIIPLQQSFSNKVRITTSEVPTRAGIYDIKDTDNTIQYVSYNYDSSESLLRYYNLDNKTTSYQVSESVTQLFDQLKEENSIHELWKWFVIFALLFLIIEIVFLKFLK